MLDFLKNRLILIGCQCFSINKKSLFGFKEGTTEEFMVGSLSQWLICLVTTLLTLTDAVCISSFLNHAGRHSHVCIPGWQCQDSLSSNCEKSDSGSMRNHSHTWTGHHRVITLTLLKVFGMWWVDFEEGSDYAIVNTRINATLDENKWLLEQGLMCATFLFGQEM